MKHAREDYNRIQDPAGLIPDDEPVFLLRGQDILAPDLLRTWAIQLLAKGGSGIMAEMVMKWSKKMTEWQEKHKAKLPDLPEYEH
ncbi:hypothetical protein A2Z67_02520 [Candidatus Woesebacteria bacterium RBG_13_36_22]|uniref:Uncharacterized protein n=1 Tax=Candidatus Woesebacteria bacterium RBG_13_36_22 TaxID=1802478 RepID=A0A1F7X2B0_9BACT|nr:MAG: hypothetical protein A2Z67_02520 [Candidatus Woesebacteria bacterium RBG_13_36_22]